MTTAPRRSLARQAPGTWIVTAVVAAGLALSWADQPVPLDAVEFQQRLERWRSMDEPHRCALRERWRSFQALSEERRTGLQRRLGALRRLRGEPEPSRGVPTPREAVRLRLGQVEALARKLLVDATRPDVRSEVRKSTLRRVRAFLGNLVRQGRIDTARRDRMLNLSTSELVSECLALQKGELLALYEGMVRREEFDRLQRLEPVEVIDRMRRKRQQRGLLGEAGRLLELPDIRRKRVAEALEEGQFGRVVEYLSPHIRELLERRGVAPEVIEETLAMPYAHLERRAHWLLRSTRSGSSRQSPR